MKIEKIQFPPEESCNTFFLSNEKGEYIVVDPGSNLNGRLDSFLDRRNAVVVAYLITHGHYDHISGLKENKHPASVYLSFKEDDFLVNPDLNLTSYLGGNPLVIDGLEKRFVSDEQEINLPSFPSFKVLQTPFHTIGSVCYYFPTEKALFSGDTLFHLGIGRTDLPTGSERTIVSSLRKFLSLPNETKVYPGHGPNTTLENEFRYNPYFKGLFK